MKELKALEILKYQRDGFLRFDRDTKAWDESIAELEAILEPKTCDGCKYYDWGDYSSQCLYCIRIERTDNYEPKDSQCTNQ